MSAILKFDGSSVNSRTPVARKPRELGRSSKIYFILCQATGRVKCGVAYDPRSRLADLQVGLPPPLKLIAEIDGNDAKEKLIHRRLSQWHIHGEWFCYVPEVCNIILEEISNYLKDLYTGERMVMAISGDPASPIVPPTIDPRLHRFLSDYTVSSPSARTQSSILYRSFSDWCQSIGLTACSQKAFTMAMSNAGYRRVTSNVVFFLDIRLKSEDERKM